MNSLELYKKGNNWKAFQSQLEAFMILNDVVDAKKTPLLLTKLSTQVFEELQVACEGTPPITLSYDNLITKLKNIYARKENVYLRRYALRERVQKPGENIRDFVTALQILAHECEFVPSELKKQLKDQVIAGTNSNTVRYELLKSPDADFEAFIELARTMETAESQAEHLRPVTNNHNSGADENNANVNMIRASGREFRGSRGRGFYSQNNSTNRNTRTKPPGSNPSSSADECYCCGIKGHRKPQCKWREKFCSECGKQGHVYRVCCKYKSGQQTEFCEHE